MKKTKRSAAMEQDELAMLANEYEAEAEAEADCGGGKIEAAGWHCTVSMIGDGGIPSESEARACANANGAHIIEWDDEDGSGLIVLSEDNEAELKVTGYIELVNGSVVIGIDAGEVERETETE